MGNTYGCLGIARERGGMLMNILDKLESFGCYMEASGVTLGVFFQCFGANCIPMNSLMLLQSRNSVQAYLQILMKRPTCRAALRSSFVNP